MCSYFFPISDIDFDLNGAICPPSSRAGARNIIIDIKHPLKEKVGQKVPRGEQ